MLASALVSLVASFTPPLPGSAHLRGPGRMAVNRAGSDGSMILPDMSPNSLLFTQDHGPVLDYFCGGDLKALWQAIPRMATRDCCAPLNFFVGGNLMCLWSSVAQANQQCLSTSGRAVAASRHAAISMSESSPRCMPAASVDYFTGGNLVSLWKATKATNPREHRMRRPVGRSRSPVVGMFGAAACPLDAEDLNFFSGGSLRCLWLRAASLDFKADCMRNEALNFFAGGDLLSLWKDAHC